MVAYDPELSKIVEDVLAKRAAKQAAQEQRTPAADEHADDATPTAAPVDPATVVERLAERERRGW